MTTPDFEAPHSEAPRRVLEELPMELMNDLRAYEAVRSEKERDTHIAYARSAARQIHEGLPIAVAIQYMRNEIPRNNFNRHQLIPFINHLLHEDGSEVQFDTSLNAYERNSIISSGDTESHLQEYEAGHEQSEQEMYAYFAERYGAFLMGSLPFDTAIAFAKADVVQAGMDNKRVAECMNAYFEAQGSTLRIDRYLERAA